MSMLRQIAAASVAAVLLGYTFPASSQTTETTTPPSGAPAEIAPTTPTPETPNTVPAPDAQPLNTPATETPATETQPDSTTPSTTETAPPTETQPIEPSTAPPTEIQPAAPTAPSTSTPSTTPSAGATPTEATAKTMVLDSETITGIKEVSFPTPPVTPAYFTLPIQVRVVKDASITSNTPITDKSGADLSAWAAAIRACVADKPAFVRVVEDQEVPFMVNGGEGKVRLNANDKPVCSA